jgi:hypothetical protein
MPFMHIQFPGALGSATTPLTLCGRQDIPRALTGEHLEDAQDKATESAWTVCPLCTTVFGTANSPAL